MKWLVLIAAIGLMQFVNNSAGPGGDLCDSGSGACNGSAGYLTNGAGGKLFAR